MSLEINRRDHILVITIDRPEVLNALDIETMKELHETWIEFRDDSRLRVAILTGSGDKSFCTGADLKRTIPPSISFAESYFEPIEASIDHGLYLRAIALANLNVGKPIIAAVNGYAIGGGLEIALNCDIRIAAVNATFALPEPQIGSIPAVGGITRLLQGIPSAVAMRMLLTGEAIDSSEALRFGLVSDVVEQRELMPLAMMLATRISSNAPLAIRAVKTLAASSSHGISDLEELMWGMLRDTDDRREGREAFVEKRPPHFKGR